MTSALPSAVGRIADLRAAMNRHGVDALLIPSSDPHLSEYLAERWQSRQWASGFTGSVGNLVITRVFAGLFADSRYWIQAERELSIPIDGKSNNIGTYEVFLVITGKCLMLRPVTIK